jgi:hypothetical protein
MDDLFIFSFLFEKQTMAHAVVAWCNSNTEPVGEEVVLQGVTGGSKVVAVSYN